MKTYMVKRKIETLDGGPGSGPQPGQNRRKKTTNIIGRRTTGGARRAFKSKLQPGQSEKRKEGRRKGSGSIEGQAGRRNVARSFQQLPMSVRGR